jgi:hypothetical protein
MAVRIPRSLALSINSLVFTTSLMNLNIRMGAQSTLMGTGLGVGGASVVLVQPCMDGRR